jgi:hypothetical protein
MSALLFVRLLLPSPCQGPTLEQATRSSHVAGDLYPYVAITALGGNPTSYCNLSVLSCSLCIVVPSSEVLCS